MGAGGVFGKLAGSGWLAGCGWVAGCGRVRQRTGFARSARRGRRSARASRRAHFFAHAPLRAPPRPSLGMYSDDGRGRGAGGVGVWQVGWLTVGGACGGRRGGRRGGGAVGRMSAPPAGRTFFMLLPAPQRHARAAGGASPDGGVGGGRCEKLAGLWVW